MRTDDFDYELPPELIAQTPADPRDSCRLLVLDRATGKREHRRFTDLLDYLDPGDLLVVNETRVLPARLRGQRAGGGAAELLLLKQECDKGSEVLSRFHGSTASSELWECLARPGRRIRVGDTLGFGDGRLTAEVVERRDEGRRLVRLSVTGQDDTVAAALHAVGETPLPPYITRSVDDPELYQTVYANAEDEHSAAAPTAGLHFTPELLRAVQDRGVGLAKLRLDVGLDTFRPVTEDDPHKHAIHTEYYFVPPEAADAINATHARGNRVIAVGTTVVRALESAAAQPVLRSAGGSTSLYILPGFTFQLVDALITNFHVPRSTLVMLVSAFATREQILAAYQEAVACRYRFFSFGDAMLIR
ncbi:MAG: tRNA preQ1(34) S-adenosylmethionine ribosyltransferase-isomerase QueA [Actinomycetia bacterium]|nr:tRNA preQ1(34) S-adenosylmethionine ribosyltransferase-isomerase QueA [Actinomycetes bacterium]